MSRPPVRPLTEDERRLTGCSTLRSQLPVLFSRTGCTLETLTSRCEHCGVVLPPERLFGSIGREGEAFARFAHVWAIGYCEACEIFTKIEVQIYDDLRMAEMRDGVLCVTKPPVPVADDAPASGSTGPEAGEPVS